SESLTLPGSTFNWLVARSVECGLSHFDYERRRAVSLPTHYRFCLSQLDRNGRFYLHAVGRAQGLVWNCSEAVPRPQRLSASFLRGVRGHGPYRVGSTLGISTAVPYFSTPSSADRGFSRYWRLVFGMHGITFPPLP